MGSRGPLATLILRDVSERERAEDALRVSEDRFRTSLDTMLDCFGIYGAMRNERGEIVDFRCEYLNEAARRVSGPPTEEQVGKRLSEVVPGYVTGEMFRRHRHIVESGEPLVVEDYTARSTQRRTATGMTVFDVRAVKLGDGFASAWRDITERKQVEAQLTSALEELERSNAALDEFAHVASHDLTEPLTTVSLYAQTLSARYGSTLDQSGQRLLEHLREVVDKMGERVDTLLTYAAVHAEPPAHAPVDAAHAVREALEALEGSITARQAQVACTPLPMVRGDPAHIRRLFQNLISNAIKFSPQGRPPQVERVGQPRGRRLALLCV